MIKVFFNENFINDMWAKEPGQYVPVAIVDLEDIDYAEVFRVCNHIDEMWWKNPEVIEVFGDLRWRSMSVGDMVELSDGRKFRCMPVGWEELNADDSQV